MTDIESDLCELPTGVHRLEFLPRQEITLWDGALPSPLNRWYGIAVYRDSLTYEEKTEKTEQGSVTTVNVGCLVVNDSQAIADQLDLMESMRFALRVTHYDGKRRLVGSPEKYCDLVATSFSPAEIVGAQGYQINFSGKFTKRPAVI